VLRLALLDDMEGDAPDEGCPDVRGVRPPRNAVRPSDHEPDCDGGQWREEPPEALE